MSNFACIRGQDTAKMEKKCYLQNTLQKIGGKYMFSSSQLSRIIS